MIINFESTITQEDVFTANGVIHYLDAVIVDADSPPPPDPNTVCDSGLCASDDALSQQCATFLNNCLMVEDEDECAGGALLICEGGVPEDVDQGNVCSQELCAVNSDLAHECQTFLDNCLLVEDEDECVGGALLVCRDLF